MRRFYVETFGCTANTSATELMIYQLKNCGYQKTDSITDADFVLVNTCIVKAPTENKIKSLLRKLYKKYPLIVAGCLPQVLTQWCQKNIPQAVLLGVDHFGEICQAVNHLEKNKKFINITRDKEFCPEIKRARKSAFTGILEISKGCTGDCAYCIVKIAKGPLVSKTKAMILSEARNAIANGCKELWLTAQDTASYGIDIGTNLISLLKQLIDLDGNFMIRIGMMNVDCALNYLDDLIQLLQHPKLYSFLHIPLQAGSDKVLKAMKRKYRMNDFYTFVSKIKEVPSITLSTDIITGFPGETDEDFQKTIHALKEVNFDIVNISKYGDRHGTEASKSALKLPTEIVKERSRELTKIVARLKTEKNKQWIGWVGKALALRYEKNNSATLLRNKSYKLIALKNKTLELGKWYRVKITKGLKTRLIGEIIE